MTFREFLAWRHYSRIVPFGPEVLDLQFAQLAALFYNAHRDEHAAARPVGDFAFATPAPTPRQTPTEQLDLLRAWGEQLKARRRG